MSSPAKFLSLLLSVAVLWEDYAHGHRGAQDTLAAFDEAVAAIPNVVQAQRLFGDPDYLLRVVTADLDAYQRLYESRLTKLPGLQRITSTIVMKKVVEMRPLPTPPH